MRRIKNSEWITLAEVARRLGMGNEAARRVVGSGQIRVRHLPGMHPEYNAADLAELMAASVSKTPTWGRKEAACPA